MGPKNFIGFEIRTLSNLIKRRGESSKVIGEADKITGMHGWVIGYLYDNLRKGDVFQRDLEAEFSIRRPTATGILQLMEKNGLIERVPVDYDARLKKLVLTPKAIAIHEKVDMEINLIEEEMTKGLTKEEINSFLSILRKIKKNME
ncbi:transcriptional regulator SlyA [Oxobacter pfennigii]|uniref:Transcriptional regulator SlyA n=1 Tax=Oxobacter pfennigii TaxID=36849 RepID=A0A0P8YSS9_9CLOT|nr:MarR family winged helix-turn-helix transcriptional regulator [Oxobacter pfennigii]KPU42734.1 transcriptional regulator SlyA [Oxobacter pfennigii]